jgi:hypothetical protein
MPTILFNTGLAGKGIKPISSAIERAFIAGRNLMVAAQP